MIDIDNPLHLAIGQGVSANSFFGRGKGSGARRQNQLRRYKAAEQDVFGESPLWPFTASRTPRPEHVTIYEANRRLHRRRGWWFYQMDMLVEDTATGFYEWRTWGVSFRRPRSFRYAQREAIRTFDAEVAGKAGTDLRTVAAIPREVRRFE